TAALRTELPPSASAHNPVDLAGAGERNIATFAHVLATALGSTQVDGALVTGYFGGYGEYGPTLAEAEVAPARTMAEHMRSHRNPVAVHTMYPDSPAAKVLTEHGVPVFHAVEDAVRTLALLGAGGRVESVAATEGNGTAPPLTAAGYWDAR